MCLALYGLWWWSASKRAREAVGVRNMFAVHPLIPFPPHVPHTTLSFRHADLVSPQNWKFFLFSFSFSKLSVKHHCLPIALWRLLWEDGGRAALRCVFCLLSTTSASARWDFGRPVWPPFLRHCSHCGLNSSFSPCPLVTTQHHKGKKKYRSLD